MVKLIVVRHGLSMFNHTHTFSGQYDVPLDPLGIEQARLTAEYIKENYKIDKIYSSDLSRTVETIRPTAEAFGLPIISDKRLRERSLGGWEGIPHETIMERDPEGYSRFRNDFANCPGDGGETFEDMKPRMLEVMEEIIRDSEGMTVAVSTHAGFFRALECVWKGAPLSRLTDFTNVSNASVSVIRCEGKSRIFELKGYNDHLKEVNEAYKLGRKSLVND